MWFKVSVTRTDINQGEKGNCWRCPIARAVKRAIPFKPDIVEAGVGVVADLIHVGIDGIPLGLPNVARVFLIKFNHNHRCKPFSFMLNVPKKYLKVA